MFECGILYQKFSKGRKNLAKVRGMRITVSVSTNAKNNSISLVENGVYKLKINSQPIEGRANKDIIKYLSKLLKIPKSSIRIVLGEHCKNKVIDIVCPDDESQAKLALLENAGR